MLNNYRNTQNKNEILRLFKNNDSKESFIWQNVEGRRFIHNFRSVSINTVLQTIHITIDGRFEYIHPQSIFYVKLTNNDSVCKAKYLSHSENEITLYYPKDVKTIELRSEPRSAFKKSKNVTATLVVSADVVSISTQAIHLRVIDISKHGISFYVDNKTIDKVLGSATYIFTHINEKALDKPIVIENIYAQPFTFKQGGKSKNAYKLGFRLSDELSDYFLDSLTLTI